MRRLLTMLAILSAMTATAHADDWPQFLGLKREGVWREGGIVDALPQEPKYAWRMPVGQGYAGPAVADGRVYVTDLVPVDGDKLPKSGFAKSSIDGNERVLCLDVKTGKELWKQQYPVTYRVSYPAGPRCTPTVDGDRVYTLGAMGDLLCLDAKNGEILWKKNFVKDFDADIPVWGFSSHPLVDGDKLICLVGGSEGRGVIAFDKKTGEVKWKSVTTRGDFGYGVPVIYELGKVRQLIIWHSQAIVGLDPETGKRLWNQPWEIRAALTAPMPRAAGDKLFLTAFYNGGTLLDVSADSARVVWQSKKASEMAAQTTELHSIMSTPVIKDGHIYGVCSYGELRCLKLDTGERIWDTYKPIVGKSVRWGHAFIIPHEDRYVMFNELGELIFCKLSPEKYEEISRLKIIEPTNVMAGRNVVWMHPAFADKKCFARNDKEIVCVDLAK